MNIQDVKEDYSNVPNREYAFSIFQRQSDLEDFYHKIENRTQKVFGVNSREGQVHIKDFLWRITEEIGEFLESEQIGGNRWKSWEELADGLHFITGLCVITGRDEVFKDAWNKHTNLLSRGHSITAVAVMSCVMTLGCLGNCLKMKPWKQTDVLTDELLFDKLLINAIQAYLDLCSVVDLDKAKLYEMYMRKSEVNLFRIRSKY